MLMPSLKSTALNEGIKPKLMPQTTNLTDARYASLLLNKNWQTALIMNSLTLIVKLKRFFPLLIKINTLSNKCKGKSAKNSLILENTSHKH